MTAVCLIGHFRVFHLQFACHVAKLILTRLHVDAFVVSSTYCLFAFQFERGDVEREGDGETRDANIQAEADTSMLMINPVFRDR